MIEFCSDTISTNQCEHKRTVYLDITIKILYIFKAKRYYEVCRMCGENWERGET